MGSHLPGSWSVTSFQCFSNSLWPLQVRYLKVTERSGYQALPWVSAASLSLTTQRFLHDLGILPSCRACLQVRYITTAGDYEIRMGA